MFAGQLKKSRLVRLRESWGETYTRLVVDRKNFERVGNSITSIISDRQDISFRKVQVVIHFPGGCPQTGKKMWLIR